MIFLYQVLDITKKSNKFFSKKVVEQKNMMNLKMIIFKDVVHGTPLGDVGEDKNQQSIFSFKSSNLYHNNFYTYITYLISSNDNLVRIESFKPFSKSKITNSFFDTSYIDILASDISKFKVIKKNENQYAFYIEFKDKRSIVSLFKMYK